jgi:hypothetical protein
MFVTVLLVCMSSRYRGTAAKLPVSLCVRLVAVPLVSSAPLLHAVLVVSSRFFPFPSRRCSSRCCRSPHGPLVAALLVSPWCLPVCFVAVVPVSSRCSSRCGAALLLALDPVCRVLEPQAQLSAGAVLICISIICIAHMLCIMLCMADAPHNIEQSVIAQYSCGTVQAYAWYVGHIFVRARIRCAYIIN